MLSRLNCLYFYHGFHWYYCTLIMIDAINLQLGKNMKNISLILILLLLLTLFTIITLWKDKPKNWKKNEKNVGLMIILNNNNIIDDTTILFIRCKRDECLVRLWYSKQLTIIQIMLVTPNAIFKVDCMRVCLTVTICHVCIHINLYNHCTSSKRLQHVIWNTCVCLISYTLTLLIGVSFLHSFWHDSYITNFCYFDIRFCCFLNKTLLCMISKIIKN